MWPLLAFLGAHEIVALAVVADTTHTTHFSGRLPR